jgi:CDP-paratose 2-epimerase
MNSSIPKKILVTGGCGFLGSNIAASYLKKNSEVHVIDGFFRQGGHANLEWLKSQANQSQFQLHEGDLADNTFVDQTFKNHAPFDYICHLGGQVAMTTSIADPRRDFMTNAAGTFNVLEATRQYSPDALVAYSSTNKVYGDLEDLNYSETSSRYTLQDYPNGLDESLRLDFASPYGCSKGAADQYVHDWYRNYGLKTVVFRHSSIYGGRQFSTFDQGWIGWFCSQALDQKTAFDSAKEPKTFTIAGTGKQVRDVLHAEDLIELYQAAYNKKNEIAGHAFNIGGGVENSLSLLELFDLLAKTLALSKPLVFEKLPRRQSDQAVFIANISKAKSMLQWEPRVTKEEGIHRMLEWAKTSRELV